MAGSYRVEICPNNRAGCSATQCKANNIKIQKGEIRQGVTVMFQDKQSWKYRHWGCVTPQVLHNWAESSGGDMELIDGYDDLPAEAQEKVKRAIEQKHVDDEEWNGDIECNRYNPDKRNQGMFVKTPKKKAAADEAGDEPETPAKKAPKKRGRAAKDEDDEVADEKPEPKKARGKSKKAAKNDSPVEDDEQEAPPPARKGRASKKVKTEAPTDQMDGPGDTPPAKQKRGRKVKAAPKVEDDEAEAAVVEAQPAAKKGRGRKTAARAAVPTDEAEPEPAAAKARAPKKTKAKKSGTAAEE